LLFQSTFYFIAIDTELDSKLREHYAWIIENQSDDLFAVQTDIAAHLRASRKIIYRYYLRTQK
jgi:hypothetical protein